MTRLPLASKSPRASRLPLRSALQLLADPYQWWPRAYQEHGPVFRLKLPNERFAWIVIAGREVNEFIAREGARVFDQRMTYPKAPKVLQTEYHPSFTEGSLQRHLRRQVAPGFSRQAVDPHLPAMMKWAREYVDRWQPGQRLNVTEETSRMGLNCISIFATGKALHYDSDHIRRYAVLFTKVLALGYPLVSLDVGQARRTRDALDAMIAERLEEHRLDPPGAHRFPDYFDHLHALGQG